WSFYRLVHMEQRRYHSPLYPQPPPSYQFRQYVLHFLHNRFHRYRQFDILLLNLLPSIDHTSPVITLTQRLARQFFHWKMSPQGGPLRPDLSLIEYLPLPSLFYHRMIVKSLPWLTF